METSKVYLKNNGKNAFQIAKDVEKAIIAFQRQRSGQEPADARTRRRSGMVSPKFVMSPDAVHQCFYADFMVSACNRRLQIFLEYPEEDTPEGYDTLLSIGLWGDYREILMACAEKVTPGEGYYYMDDDMPSPMKVFVTEEITVTEEV